MALGSSRLQTQLVSTKLGESVGYLPQPLPERSIEDARKVHHQRLTFQETLATATQLGCAFYSQTNGDRKIGRAER